MSKTKDYILKSQEQDFDQQEQLHELYSEIEKAEERKRIQDLQQAARGEFNLFAEIQKFNEIYGESK
jgi:ribosomal protein S20